MSNTRGIHVYENISVSPGMFLGISVEMVLAGLRDGYSGEFPSLKPACTIFQRYS